jgi:hypothetical protein
MKLRASIELRSAGQHRRCLGATDSGRPGFSHAERFQDIAFLLTQRGDSCQHTLDELAASMALGTKDGTEYPSSLPRRDGPSVMRFCLHPLVLCLFCDEGLLIWFKSTQLNGYEIRSMYRRSARWDLSVDYSKTSYIQQLTLQL